VRLVSLRKTQGSWTTLCVNSNQPISNRWSRSLPVNVSSWSNNSLQESPRPNVRLCQGKQTLLSGHAYNLTCFESGIRILARTPKTCFFLQNACSVAFLLAFLGDIWNRRTCQGHVRLCQDYVRLGHENAGFGALQISLWTQSCPTNLISTKLPAKNAMDEIDTGNRFKGSGNTLRFWP
jgi:hypothetical protein